MKALISFGTGGLPIILKLTLITMGSAFTPPICSLLVMPFVVLLGLYLHSICELVLFV